jgi:hypothetical protein
MSNFIFKETPHKIKHPSEDPNRAMREAKAKERIAKGQLTFENSAEERDYEHRVKANPHNIYGNPAFFPAETLTFATSKYMHRDCPNCGKTIYDELECMYCCTDLKDVQPY